MSHLLRSMFRSDEKEFTGGVVPFEKQPAEDVVMGGGKVERVRRLSTAFPVDASNHALFSAPRPDRCSEQFEHINALDLRTFALGVGTTKDIRVQRVYERSFMIYIIQLYNVNDIMSRLTGKCGDVIVAGRERAGMGN